MAIGRFACRKRSRKVHCTQIYILLGNAISTVFLGSCDELSASDKCGVGAN